MSSRRLSELGMESAVSPWRKNFALGQGKIKGRGETLNQSLLWTAKYNRMDEGGKL
jgi:hypothetical protein